MSNVNLLVNGRVLLTKDGRRFGNAIIAYDGIRSLSGWLGIVTDFGNTVLLTEDEVLKHFHIGNIIDVQTWLDNRDHARTRFLSKYWYVEKN